ncbi:GNAT family N-acetyltransferase [Sphingomonas sp.]|jgi:CelD/BcsL family acetyltransferase involved in cellulose biosynthesis|uniref:GNAT family N-acetyltransferase n=1 Tax=Sphingomonas sp. TaxID=28214 RepID=UPI002ED96340
MTKPIPPVAFAAADPVTRIETVDGLPAAIDAVAEAAAAPYRFLRAGWFAAAVTAYGGQARTIVAYEDEVPVAALPLVGLGSRMLGLVAVPGSYWPFRSIPLSLAASDAAAPALLAGVARTARGLRIGPVHDDDPAAAALIGAARAQGWAVIDRFVARDWRLDMAEQRREGVWPRLSTLRKNRFHEKHLAAHGRLDWHFVDGTDWPEAFAALGQIEDRSWIATSTDGGDAKFTRAGHLAFWQAAARDPVLASMFHAALLTVDGNPAAFSFDMDVGTTKYAIANSYVPTFAKHSPGKLLYWRNLADALDRGMETVDWGAGDRGGYKQVIGAERGPAIRDWLLLRPGVPATLGRLLAGAWRRSGRAADI